MKIATKSCASRLARLSWRFAEDCQDLSFDSPVTHVYNPLIYARQGHFDYLKKYANGKKTVLFLGINPGPWGMAQTGVPFGDVVMVRDWLGISSKVQPPPNHHPKRPVAGFDCKRSEVSGRRLWGLFAERFSKASEFFEHHLVLNYCPLLFSVIADNSCLNITPDKLASDCRQQIFELCDDFLKQVVAILEPQFLVGIGNFPYQRMKQLFADQQRLSVGKILHPSPANPSANRNFSRYATEQLVELGIWQ